MTAPTVNDDTDQCYVCQRNPATLGGMCEPCFSRAVWHTDPPLWKQR